MYYLIYTRNNKTQLLILLILLRVLQDSRTTTVQHSTAIANVLLQSSTYALQCDALDHQRFFVDEQQMQYLTTFLLYLVLLLFD